MLAACQAVCGSVEAVCGSLQAVCLVAQAATVYQGRVSCRLSGSVCLVFLLPPSLSCCRPLFLVAALSVLLPPCRSCCCPLVLVATLSFLLLPSFSCCHCLIEAVKVKVCQVH